MEDDEEIPPAEWKKMMNKHAMKTVDIEAITRWLNHPKKERFINWRNDYFQEGRTMLLCAVDYRRKDVVELLLHHGADITSVDEDGSTALMYASCSEGDTDDLHD